MTRRHPRLLALAALCLLAPGCREEDFGRSPASGTPVRTEVVAPGPFQPSLTLLGTVRPLATFPVTAPVDGVISYPPRFASGLPTGAVVSPEEPLASVENERTRLQLAEARLAADLAAQQLSRARRAATEGILATAELEQKETEARLAREPRESAERSALRQTVRAPAAGVLVVGRTLNAGTEVAQGSLLAEVVARAVRVEATAAASERERLRPGLACRFVGPGRGAPAGEGTVAEVAPVVDAAGTIRVVVSVADGRALPAPGEGVEVLVGLEQRPAALTVPEEAPLLGADGSSVFVLERAGDFSGADRARRRAVTLGASGEGRVEVLQGLSQGDRVAVSGAALLSDGATVVEVKPTPAGPR